MALEDLRVYDREAALIDNLELSMMPGLRLAYLTLAQESEYLEENPRINAVLGTLRTCIAIFETIADSHDEEREKKEGKATATQEAPG
ncbi:MAG TPA: hypothetical protein PLP45_02365 [Syntrophales bacterium]|nr:hypothetical protein [Syntrophales bacterium]